jgi:class 3 adenylate cyclase/tetratricopeptide (TPR) repeat protein
MQKNTNQPASQPAPINELRGTLHAIAAYIPDRLVHSHLTHPQPGRVHGSFWTGSLLFADLSGFTAFSEKLSVLGKQGAEEVSTIVNQLFEALVAEVYTHQGMLLKFGGDALTAFFDAETLGPLHATAASRAALAMQERMASFAAVSTRAGTFRLGLRVGVHSGRVFAAEVGDINHIELVITGPEVNRVAMAQDIAAPGEVVISDQTAALLPRAALSHRNAGFQQITAMPSITIPIATRGPDTPQSLTTPTTRDTLEAQIAALRPYLVQGLPRRFLDFSTAEQGEFRPVTVLFINFHDFSAILTSLNNDAPTAAHILNAYFCRAQEVIHHYEGIVNKVDMYTHGDKLMVLFGAPSTHEDDPLRAVRCALELETALHKANQDITTTLGKPGIKLHQRIGINTGTVFAGRVGGTRRYEYTVMGSTVNLAARLMAAADDGTILVSPATRAAVAHQIDMHDYIPLHLKGMSHPVIPARVVQLLTTEPRQRMLSHTTTSDTNQRPLIGRNTELASLKAEASLALQGRGRVLALVGEAGIGKTRLADELVDHLINTCTPTSSQGIPIFTIYTEKCQSYEQRTPYSAIRTLVRHMLGLSRDDTHDQAHITSMLQMRVSQLAPQFLRFIPLLGDLLGTGLPETTLTRALTAEQRHNRLQELVVALFKGAATREPLLVYLDSVQWADTSSLELLNRLTHAITTTPLLLLLNYRPDPSIDESWSTLPTTTRLLLHELPAESSQSLLTALLDGPPPQAILPLLNRSQGNPFFIEELVRALIESQILARNETNTWHITGPLDQATVPTSIEGLILARLDRLGEHQYELVQIASVIGQRFEHTIIEHIYSQPAPLETQIERLIRNEIITPEHHAPTEHTRDSPWHLATTTDTMHQSAIGTKTYLFRHALLRDVAYEGILYARRRELHRRVAHCLETLTGHHPDEYAPLLAQHYLLAEEWEPAFTYHLQAGIQAQERYANRDALALFNTALTIVPHLQHPASLSISEENDIPENPPDEHTNQQFLQIIEINERLGNVHVLLGEYDEAESAYLAALAIFNTWRKVRGLWRTGDEDHITLPPQFASINTRLHRLAAIVHERRADYDQALLWLDRGMQWAIHQSDLELGRCYLLGAGIYQRQGQYLRSLEWAQRGLQIVEHEGSTNDTAHACYTLGATYNKLGRTQEAITSVERSLQLFEEIGNVAGQADAHNNLAMVLAVGAGRLNEAIVHNQAAMELKEAIGDVHGLAILANNLGDLKRHMGDYDDAMHYFRIALDQFTALGSDYGMAVIHMNMGAVCLNQGNHAATHTHLEHSIQLFQQTGTEEFLAELYTIYAELALVEQRPHEALQWADQSLILAQKLDARSDEGASRRIRGLILHALDRTTEALTDMRQACHILTEVENYHALARCLEDLATLTPDPQEAAAAQRKIHHLQQK